MSESADPEMAQPAPSASSRPRRARSSAPVAIVLSFTALLTTLWTALSMQPANTLLGYRPAFSWKSVAGGGAQAIEGTRYERVSERFLLQQVVRAFLAAPWLMPDAGATHTARTPLPRHP